MHGRKSARQNRQGLGSRKLNHKATAFLNRKALPDTALSHLKICDLCNRDFALSRGEDAGILAYFKDDNEE